MCSIRNRATLVTRDPRHRDEERAKTRIPFLMGHTCPSLPSEPRAQASAAEEWLLASPQWRGKRSIKFTRGVSSVWVSECRTGQSWTEEGMTLSLGMAKGDFEYKERARARDRHGDMGEDEVKTAVPAGRDSGPCMPTWYFREVKQGHQVILPRKPEDLKSDADKIRWSRGSPAPHLTFSSPVQICPSCLSSPRLETRRSRPTGGMASQT